MTPSESANHFYDNRHEKERVIADWCDVCKRVTRHAVIEGNNGLEDYDYYICQVCGH